MGSIRVPGQSPVNDPRPRPKDHGEATVRAISDARCPRCGGSGHPHPGGLAHGTVWCPTCRGVFSYGPWLRRDTDAELERRACEKKSGGRR